jgi:ArsR family transcriptional regulator
MNNALRALKGAADPNRLRILRILREGPFNVAELTDILEVGQSTVSRHLRILSEAGLVGVRRAGTWSWYSLAAGNGQFPGALLQLLAEDGPPLADSDDAPAVERVLALRRRNTSEFFRRTAGDWDRVREKTLGPPVHLDRLLARVGRPATAVDLGTGTGVLLERIAAAAERVIGVDASPEMLEEAQRRIRAAALTNTELRLGTLEHLPLGDAEADTMVANMVLHHVADVPGVLREIRRALAPGGRLLIADLEEHADESFWRALGAQWPGFRLADLEEWLLDAGFTSVRLESTPDRREDGPPLFLAEAVCAAS